MLRAKTGQDKEAVVLRAGGMVAMRESNVWKVLAWLIREELRETSFKEIVLAVLSFLVSAAVFLLIFRR